MARNSGNGHRIGSVRNRTQFQHPNGHYIARDTENGRFKDVKSSPGKFKGFAVERDGRRNYDD